MRYESLEIPELMGFRLTVALCVHPAVTNKQIETIRPLKAHGTTSQKTPRSRSVAIRNIYNRLHSCCPDKREL